MKKFLLLICGMMAGFAGMHVPAQAAERSDGTQLTVTQAKALEPEAAKRLTEIGAKVFGIQWVGKLIAVADRGFQVVTDRRTILSYRPAGNGWIVQNAAGRSEGSGFRGSDSELISRGRKILSGLGVESGEIANVKVLQQYVTAGVLDPATRRMRAEQPHPDRRTLLVTRAIRNIPVWSSRLQLDVNERGNVVAFEMSWPRIEPRVLAGAARLRDVVAAGGFKPPPRAGAKVQSVDAGILHSPLVSLLDEQVAAVRIIYSPTNPRFGMKPVVYLGADGKPVSLPRSMPALEEKPLPVREPHRQ